jgi:hypothetical protein
MSTEDHFSRPDELSELGGRLAKGRPQLSALELDKVKARAIAQAGREQRRGKGQFMRTRLATTMAAFALVLGGTGIVWAGAGGIGDGGSAAHKQYCPPKSPNAGGHPPCGKAKGHHKHHHHNNNNGHGHNH